MKRHEAITCLREIANTCGSFSPDSVTFVNSKPDDVLSTGFQIHIQTRLDSEANYQIKSVAEKHSLAVKEEKGKVVIYQPKQAAISTA